MVRADRYQGGRKVPKPALAVDAGALRSLAAKLAGHGQAIAGLDPSGPGLHAAAAMTATATGASAAKMGEPVKRAFAGMAAVLTEMSATANASAGDYEATEHGFASLLDRYEVGSS
jgi:Excreted virulence factor EspC, type VII ESX diderm